MDVGAVGEVEIVLQSHARKVGGEGSIFNYQLSRKAQ